MDYVGINMARFPIPESLPFFKLEERVGRDTDPGTDPTDRQDAGRAQHEMGSEPDAKFGC